MELYYEYEFMLSKELGRPGLDVGGEGVACGAPGAAGRLRAHRVTSPAGRAV
jgi:hypothetical protein